MSSMATDTPSQIYHRLVRIDIATMRAALRSLNNSICVTKAVRTITDNLLSGVFYNTLECFHKCPRIF